MLPALNHSSAQLPMFQKQAFHTVAGTSKHLTVEFLFIPRMRGREPLTDSMPADKDSPTIVFVNGIMLRFSQWGFQMPRYTVPNGMPGFEDYNLLFFDNFGHGGSSNHTCPEEYLTLCAQAALRVADHMGASRLYTLAHSMGALISLEMERLSSGRVEKMGFVSPVLSSPMHVFPYSGFVEPQIDRIRFMLDHEPLSTTFTGVLKLFSSDPLMRLWHSRFVHYTGSKISPGAFASLLRKSLELDPNAFVTAFDSMLKRGDDLGSHLAKVQVPVKILLGQHDFITDPTKTQELLDELGGGYDVTVLSNTTHWGNSERPKTVNREFAAFFDSV
ncbi:Putative aminoacrylate hydrolase RutD [Candidatus Bilamarchaeum dharawalense]|uniref:Aminoacrylate hydrolase RutD n=1 Tax=Candidatus Bilamarchaeum dharawalense TaxID=2885759 RepID=A0A5E4LXM9_9ARCH|nr:Putative aminoacrylate hydrolase RutD [Candidatus Bilamarchaeum dharawalense]